MHLHNEQGVHPHPGLVVHMGPLANSGGLDDSQGWTQEEESHHEGNAEDVSGDPTALATGLADATMEVGMECGMPDPSHSVRHDSGDTVVSGSGEIIVDPLRVQPWDVAQTDLAVIKMSTSKLKSMIACLLTLTEVG